MEGDEIDGILSEIGDGWIRVTDEEQEYIINTSKIIYLLCENED